MEGGGKREKEHVDTWRSREVVEGEGERRFIKNCR